MVQDARWIEVPVEVVSAIRAVYCIDAGSCSASLDVGVMNRCSRCRDVPALGRIITYELDLIVQGACHGEVCDRLGRGIVEQHDLARGCNIQGVEGVRTEYFRVVVGVDELYSTASRGEICVEIGPNIDRSAGCR